MILVKVKVSGKWARHLFNCSKDYIINVCYGQCCIGGKKILISLLPDEEIIHIKKRKSVVNGMLQANKETDNCPYKLKSGLCSLHNTKLKPFGCIASPFTINKNNTLIIRYRYIFMRCHGHGKPAYKTFKKSLDLIFGENEATRICQQLDNGANNVIAYMTQTNYEKLIYLDKLKHGK